MFLLLCSRIKLWYLAILLYSAIILSRYGFFFYNFVALQFHKTIRWISSIFFEFVNSLLDVSCVLAYNQSTSLVRLLTYSMLEKCLGSLEWEGDQGCNFYMITCEVDCWVDFIDHFACLVRGNVDVIIRLWLYLYSFLCLLSLSWVN